MPLFRESFRPHIKQELEYRRTHKGRQDVFSPVVRVTSLVQGTLYGNTIRGLTLGLSDYRESSLDSLTNISGKGSAIGTTYVDRNRPSTVFIPSKVNLPSPGVTDVSISTQSKSGLVFKAQVNFKFYGKEQYDFLYQTFMRPGTPILLEYGHLRTNYDDIKTKSDADNTVNLLRDLKFFKDLDSPTINSFEQDLYQTAKLVANRESGAVVGLVSNFKTSLNENNEYEASIELINALEYMFALPPEDTFLSFGENADLSNSIRANFGEIDDLDYDEKYDRVFQFILRDTGQNLNDRIVRSSGASDTFNQKYFINMGYATNDTATAQAVQAASGYNLDPQVIAALQSGIDEDVRLTEGKVPISDESYIDFQYFLNGVLPVVLMATVNGSDNCDVQTTVLFGTDLDGRLISTGAQVESIDAATKGKIKVNDRINENFYKEARNMLAGHGGRAWTTTQSPDGSQKVVAYMENPKYYSTLRSTKLKNLIINNESLYPTTTGPNWDIIRNSYVKKFDVSVEAVNRKLLNILPSFGIQKALYSANDSTEGLGKSPRSGFFVNYNLIRNSFLESNSVSEALVKILNKINQSTNGILNLKLRHKPFPKIRNENEDEISFGTYLIVYDQNDFPQKNEISDIYNFFEDDISEALSYNFDFSLPQSVASTVIADTFRDDTRNIVGDASTYQLFRNGYLVDDEGNPSITPLIGVGKNRLKSECDDGTTELFKIRSGTEEEENDGGQSFLEFLGFDSSISRAVEIANSEGELFNTISGYKEFNPSVMKAEAITQGMLNTIPTSAKVTIKLVGLDGFRFGDMFTVRNMLPDPYDENNVFMLTGYKHTINSDGWITEIDGIMIATTLEENYPEAVRNVRNAESARLANANRES
jgi:hypothetical protein